MSELSLRAILAVVRCGDNLADAKAPTPLQTVRSRVLIRSPRADVPWTAQSCPPPVPPHLHAPHPWRRTRPTPIPVPQFRPGRHGTAGMRRFLRRNEVFLVSRRQNPVLIYVAASGIRTVTTVTTVRTVRTVTTVSAIKVNNIFLKKKTECYRSYRCYRSYSTCGNIN